MNIRIDHSERKFVFQNKSDFEEMKVFELNIVEDTVTDYIVDLGENQFTTFDIDQQ